MRKDYKTMRKYIFRLTILFPAVISILLCVAVSSAVALEKSETTKAPADKDAKKIAATEQFLTFYLDLYGKHLASRDWMARVMAVISLGRIDDARATKTLLEVMDKDTRQIVRMYAWEALHARQDRLTPVQRAHWVAAAYKLAEKNSFRGDLRLGLVGLMDAGGPKARNKKLFKWLFSHTNSQDPGDIRTLWAIGDTLRRWKSPDLIKGLIGSMSNINSAYRAEVVLHRVYEGIPYASTMYREGSKVMWAKTQRRWMDWFKQAEFKEIDIGEGSPYAGRSKVMPRGEKITETKNSKWRKDLELKRFRLDRLEVVFVVDSTGSMGSTVRWIQRDVARMMRAFERISREPRIGVILYRDHGDEYVVKPYPLAGNAGKLAKALKNASARGGGDIPEAVYEALHTSVKKQKWSKSLSAQKVIVLLGDAPPHKNTLGKIDELVTKAADKRFKFYCIKIRTSHQRRTKLPNYDRALAGFDKIAKLGNGRSLWVTFSQSFRSPYSMRTASPRNEKVSGRVILREVLKAVLEKGYRDRVNPFVGIMMEYIDAPVKEKRFHFGPSRPGPSRPSKYVDPQAR